jgi:hypothetical protein
MNTKIIFSSLAMFASTLIQAQTKPADSVVVKVGAASKITVTIGDKKDIETFKRYDFQALMNDLIKKVEEKDTASSNKSSSDYVKKDDPFNEKRSEGEAEESEWAKERAKEIEQERGVGRVVRTEKEKRNHRRTYNSVNFDIGTNNYISDGKFPDQDNSLYTVKPWGSWYVGINSVQRTRLTNRLFLEWGLGVSWYNFKFENQQTLMSKDASTVLFDLDTRPFDFKKSKLTATFINASLVPMIDFGSNRRKPSFFDSSNSDSFRIGAGPYVGYRIDSYAKQVFDDNGDERKPRNHDNFYLNNLRYGWRVQMGFDDVDLFFNYDMNELFSENKGPKLNAFSFGVTF